MDVNIGDYLTFRNIVLVVFSLPLLIMIASYPFVGLISKGIKQLIEAVGYLGAIVSAVVSIELIYWTIASIIDHKYQKPQLVFDSKLKPTTNYEPFDSTPLLYLIVFLALSISTWVVASLYSTRVKFGGSGKSYSNQNPLDLQ